jgi:hypothetical protein
MRLLLVFLGLMAPAAAWADPASIITGLYYVAGLLTSVTVIKAVAYVALLAYGAASARRKKRAAEAKGKAEYNANLQDRAVTALQSLPAWRIIPGRAWVGCDVHAIFTTDKTGRREDSTTYTRPDALKHLVCVFADHECQAIHDVAINGVPLGALDGSGYVTTGDFYSARTDSRVATISAGNTSVVVAETVLAFLSAYTRDGTGEGGSFTDITPSGAGTTTITIAAAQPTETTINYTVSVPLASVRVQKHLGTSSQAVDTYLNSVVPSEWVSTDRLLDKCYLVVTLDLERVEFQGGIPQITADISGRKVYDPRKDSTVSGGSGAHRAATPSTWEWSDNAALAVRDYLQAEWGFDNDPDDIDEAYTIAAANACDARTSATVQGYAVNMVADTAADTMATTVDTPWAVGDGVRFTTSGTLPAPLSAGVTYYLIRSDYSRAVFQLATTVADAYAGTEIDITTSGSGTHTCTWHDYAMFTANGMFTTDGGQKEAILDDLAATMAGDAFYGAQWQIVAGAYVAPVMALTDDDLAGNIEIVQADTPLEQLINGVRGTFIPTGKATPTEFDSYTNSTFVTDDGQELWDDLALEFVDSRVRARNLARILVETTRNGQIIRYPAKLKAWPLQVGDRITVTNTEYGFSSKVYRVTDWQHGLTSPVLLTLQEDSSTAWDIADAATSDQTLNTGLPSPWVVQTVTLGTPVADATTGRYTSEGTWLPRVHVTWTALTGAYLADGSGRIVVLWRTASSDDWQRMEVLSNETGTFIEGVREGAPVVIEVYAVNGLRQAGPSSFTAVYVDITGNGVIGGGNLLRNSSFEVDSDADGEPDHWTLYVAGTYGAGSLSQVADGVAESTAMQMAATGLGTATTDRVGAVQVIELNGFAGRQCTYSVWYKGGGSGLPDLMLEADFYDAASGGGSSTGGALTLSVASPDGDWHRAVVTGEIPADTLSAAVYLWAHSRKSAPGLAGLYVDAAQFEIGSVPTAYAPRADELLPGVVTTPIIASGAATNVQSTSPAASSLSWSSGSGSVIPSAVQSWDLSYTNTSGRTVQMEVNFSVRAKGTGAGDTATVVHKMEWDLNYTGGGTSQAMLCDGGAVFSSMAHVAHYDLPDGDSITATLSVYGEALTTGNWTAGSIIWEGVSLRLTAILA